ncbi:TolC family protein, partial [Parabacteroides gordonii]|uniref:TolC family protein n=1 Tax=Parabacteroides gordonii TaxID=574930 RepID=UPI0026EFB09B
VATGFKETWGTPTINTKGADRLWNSVIYASVQIPLFRWGARFRERNTQKAILRSKEYAADATRDRISQEVAAAWTNLTEYGRQIGIAESSCLIAAENLDLNTFSYTEGKLPIVDVLSAQLSWIQAYSGLIQVWLQQKVSLTDYNKAVGNRP